MLLRAPHSLALVLCPYNNSEWGLCCSVTNIVQNSAEDSNSYRFEMTRGRVNDDRILNVNYSLKGVGSPKNAF